MKTKTNIQNGTILKLEEYKMKTKMNIKNETILNLEGNKMKTKTIIKNGTIFSGEIKQVYTYTTSSRINGEDNKSSCFKIEILDDNGWHSIYVDKNEKVVNQELVIVNENSPKIIVNMFQLLTLDPEEFNFIIGTIEGAGCEIQ